jgi:hypothetical protein
MFARVLTIGSIVLVLFMNWVYINVDNILTDHVVASGGLYFSGAMLDRKNSRAIVKLPQQQDTENL